MKNILYKCIDKECGHELRGTRSQIDGTRCLKCKGPVVPLREATQEVVIEKSIPLMSRKIPMPEVKTYGGFTVTISVKDTDIFKEFINITTYLLDNANEDIKEIATQRINALLNKEDIK